jgi:hypothetical protein
MMLIPVRLRDRLKGRASLLSEAKAAPLQRLSKHEEHVLKVANTLCFGAWARPDSRI